MPGSMTYDKEIKIKNKLGLHARAAAQFVKTANRFSSEITVEKDKLKVNGKSILGVLTLAAAYDSTIRVICKGSDAQDALAALESLVVNKFQEE